GAFSQRRTDTGANDAQPLLCDPCDDSPGGADGASGVASVPVPQGWTSRAISWIDRRAESQKRLFLSATGLEGRCGNGHRVSVDLCDGVLGAGGSAGRSHAGPG